MTDPTLSTERHATHSFAFVGSTRRVWCDRCKCWWYAAEAMAECPEIKRIWEAVQGAA